MRLLIMLRTYWFAVTLLLLALITLLSLIPLPAHLPLVPSNDKIQHFTAYAALMFSVALRRSKYWLAIGLFLVFWSGAIELIQPYVNRQSDWMDLLANCTGIVIGSLLALTINRLFLRRVNLK